MNEQSSPSSIKRKGIHVLIAPLKAILNFNSVIYSVSVNGFDPHSDSESSLRPATLPPGGGGVGGSAAPGGVGGIGGGGSLNNDPSRSNSLMSETSSSQPDVHPFYKVDINIIEFLVLI